MSGHRVFVFSEGDVEADDVFRKVQKLEEGTRLLRAGPANHQGVAVCHNVSFHLRLLSLTYITGDTHQRYRPKDR
jgi:hypothetical protein